MAERNVSFGDSSSVVAAFFDNSNDCQWIKSGSFPAVEVEQSAKALMSNDFSLRARVVKSRTDDLAVQSLVMTLGVIVLDVFADGVSQRGFTEEDHSIQAFMFFVVR